MSSSTQPTFKNIVSCVPRAFTKAKRLVPPPSIGLAGRILLLCAVGALTLAQIGCTAVPRHQLSQSQNRARQLYEQNQALAVERQNAQNAAATLAAQQQQLQQEIQSLRNANDTDRQLLASAQAERDKLRSRYTNLLDTTRNATNPLSAESTRQFEDLARRYPNFEFDPQTGVSKFHSDVLFASGSAEVQQNSQALLNEFAKILNQGDAQDLNILVVGHTDDQRIAKSSTRSKHPSNLHLSAHRAINVCDALAKHGLQKQRMGIAGYGPYQPRVANRDNETRQQNRRVEIFVLAPNAPIAGLDAGIDIR